jgi:hypothetical protein
MVGSKFKEFPFALTASTSASTRASPILVDGVTGASPASDDDHKLVYTPSSSGFSQLRYESTTKVYVTDTPSPSFT